MQSLAEFLGVQNQLAIHEGPVSLDPSVQPLTSKAFCEAVLNSYEFRTYILNSLTLGSIPAAVVLRIMEMAWGKPPERVEHTGKDGKPIESITEVRRVVVHATAFNDGQMDVMSETKH